jgi:hypothetical protein
MPDRSGMELHQIQLAHHVNEDRVLCRTSFKVTDGSLHEVRAWLTRRLIRQLWAGIVDALRAQVSLDKPQAAHASADIIQMEHQAFVDEIRGGGSFDAPYEGSIQVYPLGEAPLLVEAVQFTLNPDQPIRINFTAANGSGFELALTLHLLHGFCAMLKDAVRNAEWDVDLELPAATLASSPSMQRVLN